MPWKRYQLTATLLEDLHSGTGTGSGAIDAIQSIDRQGRPVLRASHVKGVLREAAKTLDSLQEKFGLPLGFFSKEVFGTATTDSRIILTSLYSQGDSSDWQIVWSSSARQGLNRAPKEDTLRVVEYVRAGHVFRGELQLYEADDEEGKLKGYLDDCLRHSPALGSRRNRGDGRIRWEIKPLGQENTTEIKPQESQTQLRLLLRNLDAVCFARTGNPGNIIPTEGYIRGQRLLGALVQWSLQNIVPKDAQHPAHDFFRQQIRVGNAYPLPAKTEVSDSLANWTVMPVPQNVGLPKPESPGDGSVPWWVQPNSQKKIGEERFDEKDDELTKLKRPSGFGFLFQTQPNESWQRYQPIMGVHMRNQVRADELFSEEELAEETLFLADIRFNCHDSAEKFAKKFAPLLAGQSWLTMGSGRRPFEVCQAIWMSPPQQPEWKPEKSFVLTLASDLIARADNLGFYQELNIEALQSLLTDVEGGDCQDLEPKSFGETEIIYGFNAASGLPRVPMQAIQRGSAVKVCGDQQKLQALYEALAKKIASGLGERTWEGFGQFKLDFDPLKEPDYTEAAEPNYEANEQECLLQQAHNTASKITNLPSRTQLQGFRKRIAAAQSEQDITKAFDFYTERKKKKGGKPWDELGNNFTLQNLQDKTNSVAENLDHRKAFLDYLMRNLLIRIDKESGNNG